MITIATNRSTRRKSRATAGKKEKEAEHVD